MRAIVERCVLCCSSQVAVARDGRLMTMACQACGAVVRVEFDPPDEPTVRGRIELLVAPESSRLFQS